MWTSDFWIPLVALPMAFIGGLALVICTKLAQVERDNAGRPTQGGKNLIRARLFLILNCGSYILIVFVSGLKGPQEYAFVFWNRYKLLFLSLAIVAALSAILAIFYGFRAQGRRSWVLRIATPIVAIASIFATLSFPYGD
jgi:hypothetical protein